MFVQLFSGWRYRDGARERIAAMDLGGRPTHVMRPDVPGLLARLLATESDDPGTGIGVWVWEDEAACRAYEASRPAEVNARLAAELDESEMTEQTFEALAFTVRPD
ncbi:MAG: hypothetical protein ABIV26_01045 [Candidatus Limnocylindrales bacterium]